MTNHNDPSYQDTEPVRIAITKAFRMIDIDGASREAAARFLYDQLVDEDRDTIIEALMKVCKLSPHEGYMLFSVLSSNE